jgi:nucleoside-diphosphate-sugar epimerase
VLALLERKDLAPVIQNEASHEIPRQFLDCSKARRELAWRPRRTLEQGVRETIDWYRKALA